MTHELLKRLILDQREELHLPEHYVERSAEKKLSLLTNNKEIIVLTGIRRCGKSVLMQHLRQIGEQIDYYFNFEDDRLVNFTIADFQVLYEVFIELFGLQKIWCFDEIQNIPDWELFVRRLYNAGNKIYITGSNASLFSEELGTRLTGRYIKLTLFPFSFLEFLHHASPELTNKTLFSTIQIGQVKHFFKQYCALGGFPEYIHYQQTDYLRSLFEGILYRDIISRYKISNPKPIKELIFYLASNCSKEMTFNALRKLLGLGSATTVSDYCSALENSFLCFFVNRYNFSVKIQMQSPKKVYFIDHVLAKIIGFRFSDDIGRVLENIVYLELRRRDFEVFYHRDTKECDFVIRQNGRITMAIQVCKNMATQATRQREIEGVLEAMKCYALDEGFILTENEEETIRMQLEKNLTIKVFPIWKWLLLQ